MQQENSLAMFEKESIVRLLLKFALPAIASMVVNSIYNIVDQIFIGQGVGMLGNAATNLTFPLVTFSMALGTMIADGCVAFFSIKLGQKRYDEATRTMGNGITVALLAGLFLTVFMELFLKQILLLCGGANVDPVTLQYAVEYARITLIGLPFVGVSMTVSSIIRAQGSPRYAMLCNMAGCFLNIILDAWFVLGLHWGVAGAAWATIIGQALNFVLSVAYIPKFKSIKFELKYAKLERKTVFGFLPLGISSFFTQFASTVVVICMNNLLTRYGAESVYGADIPLAAQGIVMKVNSIVISVMVGLGIGSQPIVGYNYGAKNFKRVKQTYWRTVIAGLTVGVIGWAVFQFCTQSIIDLFGQESELYNQFALKCFHIFLSLIFVTGFLIPSGIFFQSIGKPLKAMIATMTRQLLYFLPCAFIMGSIMGVEGLLYAGPTGDLLAVITVAILIFTEMRILNREIAENQ